MSLIFLQPLFFLLCLFIPLLWGMVARSALPSRREKLMVASVRSGVILLAATALAQPQWQENSDQVNVFFVLDASDSVLATGEEVALDVMEAAVAGMGEEDQAGLIVFGKHPSLEIPLKPDYQPKPYRSEINPNFTNIYDALQLAIGKLPERGNNRIVLLSDGNENLNQAEDMSFLANSLGIEIHALPLESWEEKNEVYLEKLETPTQVPLDSPFEIRVVVASLQPSQSELVVLRNDQLIANHKVDLQAGKNVFRLIDTLATSGIYSYKTLINPEEDSIYQNNAGLAFTDATRKSGLLYLTDAPIPTPLMQALQEQGFQIEARPAQEIPKSMNDLVDYKAILLDNVPSARFSEQDMENLEKYVKDIGGGLLMVGGDQSFGAGGYRKTPIEKALPVLMDLPTQLVYSSLGIVFVIDKSNSMSEELRTQNKLEAAKVAVFSAIELLNPKDQVGLIAFDANHEWVVPFTAAKNRKTIASQLLSLKAEGGTKLYAGLQEAITALKDLPTLKKHVIILSDGMIFDLGSEKDQIYELLDAAVAAHITVSTVAVGARADVEFMRAMAQLGQGRNYLTNDAGNIPRIFVDEIKIVTRKVILEKELQPMLEQYTELMEGYSAQDFPAILGIDVTYPKPEATVQLTTAEGPLLATKRYGLGKTLAFTSDLSGRWGQHWLRWDDFGKFVGRMVKWVEKKETAGNYAVEIERKGEAAHFVVDVTNPQSQFLNGLELKLNVLFPNASKSNRVIALEQIAPGKYQGHFPVEETGAYYLNLYEQQGQQVVNSQTFGYGIPYTKEFQTQKINDAILNKLTQNTGGQVLQAGTDLPALFQATAHNKASGRALWPYFLIGAICLLILDVALRKLYDVGRLNPTVE